MGKPTRQDFTTDLEAVARGVRRLEEIRDPVRRDAIAAALRLRNDEARLDPAARARMRRQVLAAVSPVQPTFVDGVMAVLAVLAKPAPSLVRGLAILLAGAGLIASATVASADSLPDDALYGFKLAGEQLRLAIASTPEDRAAVDLSIASHRLDEAERLAAAGRADATIDMTAAYGLSLATAAAELAGVETLQPKLAPLVTQLQAQLRVQQDRVAATAVRLATDARTSGAAAALAAADPRSEKRLVAPAADPHPAADRPAPVADPRAGTDAATSAVRIADAAAAVTSRVVVVAQARAAKPPEDDAEEKDAGAASEAAPAAVRSAAPPVAPRSPQQGAGAAARPTAAPVDRAAARVAARRAEKAAEQAQRAAERARENSRRTPSPSPRHRD